MRNEPGAIDLQRTAGRVVDDRRGVARERSGPRRAPDLASVAAAEPGRERAAVLVADEDDHVAAPAPATTPIP